MKRNRFDGVSKTENLAEYERPTKKAKVGEYLTVEADEKTLVFKPLPNIEYVDTGDTHTLQDAKDYADAQDTLVLTAAEQYTDLKWNSLGTWQRPVIARQTSLPPTPVEGDRYLLTEDNRIAEWNGASWIYTFPADGMIVADETTDYIWMFNGTEWVRLSIQIDHNATLGVQGGLPSERFHLTNDDYVNLTSGEPIFNGLTLNGNLNGVTPTQIGYLNTLTSNVQTQLDNKADTISLANYLPLTGGTLTGSLNGISPTKLGYLTTLTSDVQTQLGTKAPSNAPTITGDLSMSTGAIKIMPNTGGVFPGAKKLTVFGNNQTHNYSGFGYSTGQFDVHITNTNDVVFYESDATDTTSRERMRLANSTGTGKTQYALHLNNLLPDTVLVSDTNKALVSSAISNTKLGYLTDVTSNIQEQLNTKASLTGQRTYTISSTPLKTISYTEPGGTGAGLNIINNNTGAPIRMDMYIDGSGLFKIQESNSSPSGSWCALIYDTTANTTILGKEAGTAMSSYTSYRVATAGDTLIDGKLRTNGNIDTTANINGVTPGELTNIKSTTGNIQTQINNTNARIDNIVIDPSNKFNFFDDFCGSYYHQSSGRYHGPDKAWTIIYPGSSDVNVYQPPIGEIDTGIMSMYVTGSNGVVYIQSKTDIPMKAASWTLEARVKLDDNDALNPYTFNFGLMATGDNYDTLGYSSPYAGYPRGVYIQQFEESGGTRIKSWVYDQSMGSPSGTVATYATAMTGYAIFRIAYDDVTGNVTFYYPNDNPYSTSNNISYTHNISSLFTTTDRYSIVLDLVNNLGATASFNSYVDYVSFKVTTNR